MKRILEWFTIEITTGLFMLGVGTLLFFRPYALAWQTLDELYPISISFVLARVALFVCGTILIALRIVPRWAYILLLTPVWGYPLALSGVFLGQFNVGPWGCSLGLFACALMIYIQSSRQKLGKSEGEAP